MTSIHIRKGVKNIKHTKTSHVAFIHGLLLLVLMCCCASGQDGSSDTEADAPRQVLIIGPTWLNGSDVPWMLSAMLQAGDGRENACFIVGTKYKQKGQPPFAAELILRKDPEAMKASVAAWTAALKHGVHKKLSAGRDDIQAVHLAAVEQARALAHADRPWDQVVFIEQPGSDAVVTATLKACRKASIPVLLCRHIGAVAHGRYYGDKAAKSVDSLRAKDARTAVAWETPLVAPYHSGAHITGSRHFFHEGFMTWWGSYWLCCHLYAGLRELEPPASYRPEPVQETFPDKKGPRTISRSDETLEATRSLAWQYHQDLQLAIDEQGKPSEPKNKALRP